MFRKKYPMTWLKASDLVLGQWYVAPHNCEFKSFFKYIGVATRQNCVYNLATSGLFLTQYSSVNKWVTPCMPIPGDTFRMPWREAMYVEECLRTGREISSSFGTCFLNLNTVWQRNESQAVFNPLNIQNV